MPEPVQAARVAIVTGAGRGIGRAIALGLADRGLTVSLASRNQRELEAVRVEIEKAGGRAIAVPTDVSSSIEVERLVAETVRHSGPVDVLVNNAAVVEPSLITDTSEPSWDRVIDINLKGAFLCLRAVLPHMISCRRGRIVNISSISGRVGTPRLASYCASKWGLLGLTKAAAEETRGYGVQILAICPGSVDTEMLKKGQPDAEPDMSAAEVASLVVYLALDAPASMTGSVVDLLG